MALVSSQEAEVSQQVYPALTFSDQRCPKRYGEDMGGGVLNNGAVTPLFNSALTV